ncbi:MAG: hypothetical protein FWD77_01330, partial [Betaproteobacteria bacterium]|nr:hypothetical protein [Betaproteobacteria bacterium]
MISIQKKESSPCFAFWLYFRQRAVRQSSGMRHLATGLAAAIAFMTLPIPAYADIGFQYDASGARTIYIGQAIGPNPIRIVAAGAPSTASALSIDALDLPAGLSIQQGEPGPGTRDIQGTAEPGTAGTYTSHFTDTTDSNTRTFTITVEAGPQSIVQSDISKKMSDVGSAVQLTQTANNGNGDVIAQASTDAPTLTYSTGTAGIATCDANGLVTIEGKGTTTVNINSAATASYNAATQLPVTITVNSADPSISANDDTALL